MLKSAHAQSGQVNYAYVYRFTGDTCTRVVDIDTCLSTKHRSAHTAYHVWYTHACVCMCATGYKQIYVHVYKYACVHINTHMRILMCTHVHVCVTKTR